MLDQRQKLCILYFTKSSSFVLSDFVWNCHALAKGNTIPFPQPKLKKEAKNMGACSTLSQTSATADNTRITRLRLASIFLFHLLYIFCNFFHTSYGKTFPRRGDRSSPRICLICNAENRTSAQQTADRFPDFDGWFAIWKERLESEIVQEGKRHLVNASGSSHAEGWDIAIKASRRTSEQVCDYFFFIDDDVSWSVSDSGKKLARMVAARKSATEALAKKTGSSRGLSRSAVRETMRSMWSKRDPSIQSTVTPSKLLSSFIEFYLPAVVVFPWPHGEENSGGGHVDNHFPNLRVFNAHHRGSAVQPATGFDNGNIVLHSSVVDFFVPFWLGGDFVADFVIHHTFLNVFVPFLFHGDAVCLNGLEYRNPPGSRHPNDENLYWSYRKFLLPALKCPTKHWGPHLLAEDVDWRISTAGVQSKRNAQRLGRLKFPQVTDLYYMSSFFNISHPAIRESPFLRKIYDAEVIDAIERLSERVLPADLGCSKRGADLLVAADEERGGAARGQT